eukprot:TRINITY_DN33266_c1_g1_i1.p1 TRINITY_DN33266_c1_g1~~TRINITY_DN33266_c1_g1_i1.p1  ORF type:complete len:307 (+),score=54.42 TRINITY_DN33266_c1_g1_i1:98-922(+)
MGDAKRSRREAAPAAGPERRIVVGYWRHRCLGNCIRLLLAHSRQPFTDRRYEVGDPPCFDKSCWFSQKEHLGLGAFPNLPYLIDGSTRLVQTGAILRHLARRFGYEGTADEARVADMMLGVAQDAMDAFTTVTYAAWLQYQGARSAYVSSQLPAFLKRLSGQLEAARGEWAAGGLTYCDFFIYELLDQMRTFCSGAEWEAAVSAGEAVVDYMTRFEALPGVKEYMESDSFLRRPVHNRYSQFASASGEGMYQGVHPGRVVDVDWPEAGQAKPTR